MDTDNAINDLTKLSVDIVDNDTLVDIIYNAYNIGNDDTIMADIYRRGYILNEISLIDEKFNFKDFFYSIIGKPIPVKPIKRLIFETVLRKYGFIKIEWESEDKMNELYTESLKYSYSSAGTVYEPNHQELILYAPFMNIEDREHYNKFDKWDEEKQFIMPNKWIYDVHILNSNTVTFKDLSHLINDINIIRWK